LGDQTIGSRADAEYPKTLQPDPILNFALENLADDVWSNRVLYYAVWPLGKLQTAIIRLQDQWEALQAILTQPHLPPNEPCRPATLNWPQLEAQASKNKLPAPTITPTASTTHFGLACKNG